MKPFTVPDVFVEGDEISVYDPDEGRLVISVTEQDIPTELDGVLSLDQKRELQTRTVVLNTAGVVALSYRLEQVREQRIPAVKEWWEDRDNVTGLAEWFELEGCIEDSAAVIRLFEKPWKWSREFELYQLHEATGSTPEFLELRERLVEAIHDNNQTAEEVAAAWNEEHEEEDR